MVPNFQIWNFTKGLQENYDVTRSFCGSQFFFYYGILQREWSFSYNSFVKFPFNNTVDLKPDHSYGP